MQQPTISTLNDLFSRVVSCANPRAILWQDEAGNWLPLSSDQIYQRVRALAQAFLGWGIRKGDRIALICENRWEWPVTDFAALAIGAVDVPIYPTLTAEQIATLLRDSGCRIAVVSTLKQYEKLNSVRNQTPLERIVVLETPTPEGAVAFRDLVADADAHGSVRDPEFDALTNSIGPDDLATLIYTSGTTGEPKGVALTHGNIASNQCIADRGFNIGPDDACISFLPLSHVTARALDYIMFYRGAQVAYCSQFDWLAQAMRQIRPTIIVGVPRVFEKIRQEVERQAGHTPIKSRLLPAAVSIGSHFVESVYDGQRPQSPLWRLADLLVYSKVRRAFGGRVHTFVSGGAPLGIDTLRWFASVGVAIYEGYGLTETSPVIAIDSPAIHRIGSVGRPLANLSVKFAEDGELLVKGPSVFRGYWQQPAATAQCFDAEGYFATGDIAHLDEDGFLFITDRKKELLKTSGGKLVAPQPIENRLKNSSLVAQAAIVGDRHKFVCALISPNFAALEDWARQRQIHFDSCAELVTHQQVIAHFGQIVREVNATLANFESLKRFRIVAEEWTQETGELTPSMKLKRRVIDVRYAAVIDELFAGEAHARAE